MKAFFAKIFRKPEPAQLSRVESFVEKARAISLQGQKFPWPVVKDCFTFAWRSDDLVDLAVSCDLDKQEFSRVVEIVAKDVAERRVYVEIMSGKRNMFRKMIEELG